MELLSLAMIQCLKMLFSDAAKGPCDGPCSIGWPAGPGAVTGGAPAAAAFPRPPDSLEDDGGTAARGR